MAIRPSASTLGNTWDLGSRLLLAFRCTGRKSGSEFDGKELTFVDAAFVTGVAHLMSCSPQADFHCMSGLHIRDTAQDEHPEILRRIGEDPTVTTAAVARQQFRAVIASDYQVQADVVVLRRPRTTTTVPRVGRLFNASSGLAAATNVLDRRGELKRLAPRQHFVQVDVPQRPRANIRTETIALLRHRKGRMPHMVVVTAEPLPSRLRSIAIGTGEVDCVYHIALDTLAAALDDSRVAAATLGTAQARRARQRALEEQIATFELMCDGDRLRDISNLPFDLLL